MAKIIYPTNRISYTHFLKSVGSKIEQIEKESLSSAKIKHFLTELKEKNIEVNGKIANKAFARLEKRRVFTAAEIEAIKQACME